MDTLTATLHIRTKGRTHTETHVADGVVLEQGVVRELQGRVVGT